MTLPAGQAEDDIASFVSNAKQSTVIPALMMRLLSLIPFCLSCTDGKKALFVSFTWREGLRSRQTRLR